MSEQADSFDLVYTEAGENVLKAHVYPSGTGSEDVLVEVHGGAWYSGSRFSGKHYCSRIAAAGPTVVSLDFRQGPDFKHPASVEDISAALTWVRTTNELNSPRRVGLMGSSSGGHLALFTALNPRPGLGHEPVDYVIALWPVSNPLARYQYATARMDGAPESWHGFAPDKLIAGHNAYFSDEAQMAATAIQTVLSSGEFTELPPAMIVQPELDQNVPVMMSQTLVGAFRLHGAVCEYFEYPGVPHAFAHRPGLQTDACVADILDFIARQGRR